MNGEERPDGHFFRPFIGILALLGGLLGFAGLYLVEVPAGNKDAMMFALGIIFGWGSSVIGSEYGVTTTGRKVAESAIRKIERADIAATAPEAPSGPLNEPERPSGAEGDPVHTTEERT